MVVLVLGRVVQILSQISLVIIVFLVTVLRHFISSTTFNPKNVPFKCVWIFARAWHVTFIRMNWIAYIQECDSVVYDTVKDYGAFILKVKQSSWTAWPSRSRNHSLWNLQESPNHWHSIICHKTWILCDNPKSLTNVDLFLQLEKNTVCQIFLNRR